jgi:hypothetical protein
MNRKGNLLLFSVLEEGGYSPQAALLMLDCDRSLASHRYNHTGNDEDVMSDSDSDEEEDGDERSPMTALSQAPTDWILSTCLSIVLIAGDLSCLLHTDSDNRTPLFLLCIKIEELTPEALDVVSVVLEACPRLRCARLGSDDIADRLPFRSCLVRSVPTEPFWPCQYVGFFEAFLKYELLQRQICLQIRKPPSKRGLSSPSR